MQGDPLTARDLDQVIADQVREIDRLREMIDTMRDTRTRRHSRLRIASQLLAAMLASTITRLEQKRVEKEEDFGGLARTALVMADLLIQTHIDHPSLPPMEGM